MVRSAGAVGSGAHIQCCWFEGEFFRRNHKNIKTERDMSVIFLFYNRKNISCDSATHAKKQAPYSDPCTVLKEILICGAIGCKNGSVSRKNHQNLCQRVVLFSSRNFLNFGTVAFSLLFNN